METLGLKKRLAWVDCVKGFAIMAVVFDHCAGFLYTSQAANKVSFFSVGVFILISGFNAFHALTRRQLGKYNWQYAFASLKRLLLPYFLATVALFVWNNGTLDLLQIAGHLLRFDLFLPYYFLFFLLQLVLLNQCLFAVVAGIARQPKTRKIAFTALLLMAIYGLSLVLAQQPVVNFSYGGGLYLFGGTFLFLYCLGMVWACYYPQLSRSKLLFVLICFTGIVAGGLFLSIPHPPWPLDFPFGGAFFNPPGNTVLLYTIFVFVLTAHVFHCLSSAKHSWLRKITLPFALAGRYSMSIFLYHKAVIPLLDQFIWAPFFAGRPMPAVLSIPVRALVYVMIVALPIGGGLLYRKLKQAVQGFLYPATV